VCEVEEAAQQLRDELNPGALKELREGERSKESVRSAREPAADQRGGECRGRCASHSSRTHCRTEKQAREGKE
jgi:hypothetical protein